jgi:hypothetical protein
MKTLNVTNNPLLLREVMDAACAGKSSSLLIDLAYYLVEKGSDEEVATTFFAVVNNCITTRDPILIDYVERLSD